MWNLKYDTGTSLAFQRLRLRASTAGGHGFDPCKVPHMLRGVAINQSINQSIKYDTNELTYKTETDSQT